MLVAARAAAFLQHKDFGIIHRAARPPVSRSAAFPFALGLLGWVGLVYHSIRMARNFTQVIDLLEDDLSLHIALDLDCPGEVILSPGRHLPQQRHSLSRRVMSSASRRLLRKAPRCSGTALCWPRWNCRRARTIKTGWPS